jgi:hypothetical protein
MSPGTMRAWPAVEPPEHAAAVHQAIADRRAPAKTVPSAAP